MQLFAIINSIIFFLNFSIKQKNEAKVLKKSNYLSYQTFIFITFCLILFATIIHSLEVK